MIEDSWHDELPDRLSDARRAMLVDIGRLWRQVSDLRLGQMLRATVRPVVTHPAELTDEAVKDAVIWRLQRFPEPPPPRGPYWDTEKQGSGNFLTGRPRDPSRIPLVLNAFARAWVKRPELSLGELLDFALDHAGIPENEFGTRWLLIEDGPLRTVLDEFADDPGGSPGGGSRPCSRPRSDWKEPGSE